MGRIKSPGLFKRKGIWHIDKQVDGQRLRESTGSAELAEAERYLVKRIQEIREAVIYGIRPKRTFKQAADKYLKENQHKASLEDDRRHLRQLEPFIGNLLLEQVHNGTLQSFIKARQQQGRKTKSINIALGVVRHILNLAATEWLDENSLTWLHSAPKIKLLKVMDARRPYPLSWEEQDRLFAELPPHLQEMALFKVNTGCREQEVCRLRWDWELDVELAEEKTSLFLIPQHLVKNRKERIVVLNDIAKSVIKNRRGKHPHYVFTYQNHHLSAMNNSAWQRAREIVGLKQVRVHDLKHTFGCRLRAAGVSCIFR